MAAAGQTQPSFKVQVLISTIRRRPRRLHYVYTGAGMVLNTGVRLRPRGDGCDANHPLRYDFNDKALPFGIAY